jgi:hypothetical protein
LSADAKPLVTRLASDSSVVLFAIRERLYHNATRGGLYTITLRENRAVAKRPAFESPTRTTLRNEAASGAAQSRVTLY